MHFYHSIPSENGELVHQACAIWRNNLFVHHVTINGRNHDRYFGTLDEFVRWHYISQGWKITNENYDFESEATVNYAAMYEMYAYRPIWVQSKNYLEHLRLEARG